MTSEDSSSSHSATPSPLSTSVTPSSLFVATQSLQLPTNSLPTSMAITPLPTPVSLLPLPGDMSIHLSHRELATNSFLQKEGICAGNLPPYPEQALEVNTMPEVRAAIDKLDREIVTLLGTRLRFIEAAARIKQDKGAVRDEWRKRDVIQKALHRAQDVGFDREICEKVFDCLVEGCIAYEGVKWEEFRRNPVAGQ